MIIHKLRLSNLPSPAQFHKLPVFSTGTRFGQFHEQKTATLNLSYFQRHFSLSLLQNKFHYLRANNTVFFPLLSFCYRFHSPIYTLYKRSSLGSLLATLIATYIYVLRPMPFSSTSFFLASARC